MDVKIKQHFDEGHQKALGGHRHRNGQVIDNHGSGRTGCSILKEIQDEIKGSFENRIIDLDDPSVLERNPFDRHMITSTTIIRYRGGLGIRCKVDGVQQSAEPLSATEEQEYYRLYKSGKVDELDKYMDRLAERHFGSQAEEEQQTRGLKR